MLVVRASGHLLDHEREYPQWEASAAELRDWLGPGSFGGVILVGGSATELAQRSQQLQSWARWPLLLCADVEEGVGQRFAGATTLPPPLALKNLLEGEYYAYEMGRLTAREAHALGLNWLLAPVVDVNNNPANPVINVRAFGETPEQVSRLASSFIWGVQSTPETPVLTTAKHFPGHGDTATDSHLELPLLQHTRARLAEVELPPFAAAIGAGVDAVMSAHLQIPALDAHLPATLSHRVLSALLRRRMSFEGLIVTDALIMGALTRHFDPAVVAVKAVLAGADILLMPPEPRLAIRAVVQAVEAGQIAEHRIRASVWRIWQAKAKVTGSPPVWQAGGHSCPAVGTPEAQQLSQTITRKSLRVFQAQALPLPQPVQTQRLNLVLVDDLLGCGDLLSPLAPAVRLPAALGWRAVLLDGGNQPYFQLPSGPAAVLLQLFIRGNPFRDGAGLAQSAQALLRAVLAAARLRAVVLYGSPYVLDTILPTLPQGVPCVFTYDQHPPAQAIALETLFGTSASHL